MGVFQSIRKALGLREQKMKILAYGREVFEPLEFRDTYRGIPVCKWNINFFVAVWVGNLRKDEFNIKRHHRLLVICKHRSRNHFWQRGHSSIICIPIPDTVNPKKLEADYYSGTLLIGQDS